MKQNRTPVDRNDPTSAATAEALSLPATFSTKARAVWACLDDTAFLYRYKGRYVVTDESLWLTTFIGDGTPENPTGFPRWEVDDLAELEHCLELAYDDLVAGGCLPA